MNSCGAFDKLKANTCCEMRGKFRLWRKLAKGKKDDCNRRTARSAESIGKCLAESCRRIVLITSSQNLRVDRRLKQSPAFFCLSCNSAKGDRRIQTSAKATGGG